MLLFLNFLKKQKTEVPPEIAKTAAPKQVAVRKGEIGEYKIDIQLDQLPKECRYLSNALSGNIDFKNFLQQTNTIIGGR